MITLNLPDTRMDRGEPSQKVEAKQQGYDEYTFTIWG